MNKTLIIATMLATLTLTSSVGFGTCYTECVDQAPGCSYTLEGNVTNECCDQSGPAGCCQEVITPVLCTDQTWKIKIDREWHAGADCNVSTGECGA